MKKIMFNDKYGLTKAVLDGRKTMTRRVIPDAILRKSKIEVDTIGGELAERLAEHTPYCFNEVVAVAQNLRDMGYDPHAKDWGRGEIWGLDHSPSYTNKMFVSASDCIHQIRITNVRVERLQDISDEDCIREGIEEDSPYFWVPVNKSLPNWRKISDGVSDMYPNDRDGKVYPHFWDSPRKAFAALIDRLSGKGTWESDPYVFVYEFKLVK